MHNHIRDMISVLIHQRVAFSTTVLLTTTLAVGYLSSPSCSAPLFIRIEAIPPCLAANAVNINIPLIRFVAGAGFEPAPIRHVQTDCAPDTPTGSSTFKCLYLRRHHHRVDILFAVQDDAVAEPEYLHPWIHVDTGLNVPFRHT